MQLDLFNQALLLVISFLTFLALSYGFLKSPVIHPVPRKSHKKTKKNNKHVWIQVGIITLGAFLFGLIVHTAVQLQFLQDDIPFESIVWAMPLGALLVLIAYNLHFPQGIAACIGGLLCATVLLLLLANNYYHYYPTLDSFFGQDQSLPTDVTKQVTASVSNQIVFEQYYQPLTHNQPKGSLYKLSIPASGAFQPRKGIIYLPPALHGNNLIKLPVIVLLTGYPGQPTDWQNAGLESLMDTFAAKHRGLAPIVAVVDFGGVNDVDTECVDSKLGAAETYLAKDVPTYLKAHYQVSPFASDWTIAGYSAGGMCSTLIALRHPTVYRNYMNISGDTSPSLATPAQTMAILFKNSQHIKNEYTPNDLLRNGGKYYKGMNAWYYIGTQDQPILIQHEKAQALLAKNVGLNAQMNIVSGHHGFFTWKEGYVQGLSWIMHQIRFTIL